ncbi:hypothetical protein AAFF_G00121020 [Aldrovandia affinis]|uniref:PH domain-containing protein n=1 Tax=Aldrovandia affinis TaxID=143900 RepID=A0AAD7RS64_9TELE|nr:hypothetical protein AAFF_G00121020 [Aldrovandia affinis]
MRFLRSWTLTAFPALPAHPTADGGCCPVSLRQKSRRKQPRGERPVAGDVRMSRRRISVKELGQVDCQGWLYRKKEGKLFLGIKWKRYWFVLKRTSLYWYLGQMAEKAEGYVNLAEFTIDQALECKRKHAMKACHPQIMTFYFAAESSVEMSRWLNKLGAATQNEVSEQNVGECYSEASDQEEAESADTTNPDSESGADDHNLPIRMWADDHNLVSIPPPVSSPPPSDIEDSASSPVSIVTSQNNSLASHSQSWLEISLSSSPEGAGETVVCSTQELSDCPLQAGSETCNAAGPQTPSGSPDSLVIVLSGDHCEERGASPTPGSREDERQGATPDEMEILYIHLKQASLSPMGQHKPSTKKDFRSSFIKRCKNHTVNEKLHLARTLNSTLKAKEADLLSIEQVLADPGLSSLRYRQWKEANVLLLQEICHRQGPRGGSVEHSASVALYAETSV